MVTSVIDYIFRVVALEYEHDDQYCQVKAHADGRGPGQEAERDRIGQRGQAFGDGPHSAGAQVIAMSPEVDGPDGEEPLLITAHHPGTHRARPAPAGQRRPRASRSTTPA